MAPGAVVVARGRCEGSDRLATADEALAALQRACGGEIPGQLAIPALLELTRKAWHHRMKLGRVFQAQDGDNAVSAWVDIVPDPEGLALSLSNWRVTPLAPTEAIAGDVDEGVILAQVADLHARLDPRQAVLAAGRSSSRLEPLAAAMRDGFGRPWTDFVTVSGITHRQPLHWRLIDGAEVIVATELGGDPDARWRVRLVPVPGDGAAAGFDLYLVPAGIEAVPAGDVPNDPVNAVPEALDGVLGRDLAPALRQPITRIIANAETIRTRLAGPLADEYANYAVDIAEAARHLLGLVEDLADLDAIEAPGFAPMADAIDLADAARRAAGILGVRASERGITVEVPGEGESLPASGEWRRVLQVLLNLLGNALRYAPEGSRVRLTLAARGTRSALTVADEGLGLSPQQQARVFDKFERLGRSGDGGSGLGLYISRRLARAMGGDLSVESAPGEGARFTLELPSG
ncbi:sensor histidine kinase KdpD [Novosphingobium sp. Gsoil 351]|uniref:sensor histidine kinase n=1 Tax=Novosphingobium sp. Gsoil 351 TaxID=2675225 RepID=UPI0012B4C9F8|nr:HAMP domain-containing sensor histidine kinase [Novosphingobium sp. Gsoil 351]QGN53912.1 sensor histidine kinase [Novosphingobium sp. Gsoil 351]